MLNSLSGEFIGRSLSVLASGGRFVEIGKRGIWSPAQVAEVRPDVAYHVLALDEWMLSDPVSLGATLRKLMQRVEAGELQPIRPMVFPLTEATTAFRFMQQARHIGKIVLRMPKRLTGVLRPNASYLVTGGLGGLGLLTAQRLAERGARNVVLIGRNAPRDEARRIIAEIEAIGTRIVTMQADVSVADDVARVLEEISRTLPPLRGIVHSAGLLDDGVLLNQTRVRFDNVLAPKVAGAWNLHQQTETVPLDFFVLYSSLGSLLGPAGQGNYAAANAFLDGLAQQRRSRGLPTLAINWGAWNEVGIVATAAACRRTCRAGGDRFGLRAGRAGASLTLGAAQMVVAPSDWSRLASRDRNSFLNRLVDEARSAATHRREAKPTSDLSARLHCGSARGSGPNCWWRTCSGRWRGYSAGTATPCPIAARDFPSLGSTPSWRSSCAIGYRPTLTVRQLSATTVFDHPTVEALAAHLADKLALATPAAVPTRPERIARPDDPIAVVGLSCRFPGGDNPEAFWRLLEQGREAIGEIPRDRWDIDAYYDPDPAAPGKMYVRRGGFLEGIDRFDAAFFGIVPREAVSLDPQQRLLLEVAWEALEHAGLAAERLAGSRTGVFIGICVSDYASVCWRAGQAAVDAYLSTGTALSVAAGRLSYLLGLQGPSLAIDTACSSSLVAVHQACRSLRSGECDRALAGGVNLMLTPATTINFCKARMLAPDGRCKTFDAAADGYVRGEGCGVVVLKRLCDAQRDGDRVLALIRGSAVNQDGRSGGLTVPNGPAQQAVIREAPGRRRRRCRTRSATSRRTAPGTSLGDPIEVQALPRPSAKAGRRTRRCCSAP